MQYKFFAIALFHKVDSQSGVETIIFFAQIESSFKIPIPESLLYLRLSQAYG